MKKLLCFIDDTKAERDLFTEVFGDSSGVFEIICADSFKKAQNEIANGGKIPDLFVLDLYFPGGSSTDQFVDLKMDKPIFQDDEGDLTRAYLNLEMARRRYQALRISLGQSPEGGLKLIRQVKETYPGIPIITYTRKGTIEEANQALKTGARLVLMKPSGENWEDTRHITWKRREELEGEFQSVLFTR